jgi:outer membrane protein
MIRMSISRLILVFLTIGLLQTSLKAQPAIKLPAKLTLDDAVNMALVYHPTLRSAEANVRFSKAILGQTRSNLLPNVNFVATGSRIDGYFVFNPDFPARKQAYNSYSTSFQMQQVVFDFSRTWSRISANKRGVEVSKYDYDYVRDAVVTNVELAYFQVIQTRSIVGVDEGMVDQAEKHLVQAQAFYRVGKSPQFDVTQAQVDVANANVNLISARNQLHVAVIQLENAMGVQAMDEFEVIDTFKVEPFDMALDSAEHIAVMHYPELKSAEAQLQENLSLVTVARGQHLPSLLASGSYSWNGFNLPLQPRWNAGLTLSFPLFQGFGISAQVQQARANVDVAKASIDVLRQQISLQVKQYYLNLKEAEERIRASQLLVEQARENLRLAEGRYNSGVGSALEITDARTALGSAEITNIQALFDYNNSSVLLRQAMGMPVFGR